MSDFDEAALSAAREHLLNSAKTLLMSAAGGDPDLPEMGVTPMVRHKGAVYIYPSHLSAHVRAMLSAGKASFLAIEDESAAQNIWARRRMKFDADIIEIDRENEKFNLVCDIFAERHGPTMGLIRDFTDFHLLELRPTGGVMVLGFAQAYRLEGPALHVTGHLRSS